MSMPKDKYTATWVSHSSIGDFLSCPRAYYLKNVYKDPKTNHKIKLMTPPLALGSAVHEVLEGLSQLPKDKRFRESLIEKFEQVWKKFEGKKGGFSNEDTEYKYKQRGEDMLRRAINHPGPLNNLSVKIQKDLPYFWLDEEENIILCGKIDWLEYLEDTDSVHIVDFKTGKNEEAPDSLQLPIYLLLVSECQSRPVAKASYWYLGWRDMLDEQQLPSMEEARERVLKIAKDIKLARQIERFKCPSGDDGCRNCKPFEAILNHEAEFVGLDDYGADTYVLLKKPEKDVDAVIL